MKSNDSYSQKDHDLPLSVWGKRFIGGTIWISVAQIGSYVLSFGANIILVRLLAPDVFGVFALATSIFSILYILGSWSFSMAVIQAEKVDQAFFDTAFSLALGLGVILFLLTAVVSFPLRTFYSDQVIQILLVLAGLQVLMMLSSCYGATLKRDLEYKNVSLVEISSRILGLIVAIVLAWRGFGIGSLVGKQAIFVIGSFIGTHLISPWRFKWSFHPDAARRLFKFGSQMFISSGLESFLSNVQSFLIGTMLGTTALGYFDRAIKLSQLGHTGAGSAVNQVSLSAYSRLQTSPSKVGQVFETVNYFLMRIFVLVGIGFLLLGEEFTILLYGEKWRATGKVVPFLSVYIVFITIFGNIKHLLYSKAKIGVVVKIRAMQSILLVLSMLLILPRFGLAGAASIISFLYLAAVALALLQIKNFIDIAFAQLIVPPVLAGGAVLFLYELSLISGSWGRWPGGEASIFDTRFYNCLCLFKSAVVVRKETIAARCRFYAAAHRSKIVVKAVDFKQQGCILTKDSC